MGAGTKPALAAGSPQGVASANEKSAPTRALLKAVAATAEFYKISGLKPSRPS